MAGGHLKPLWSPWSTRPGLTVQHEELRDPPLGHWESQETQTAVGLVKKLPVAPGHLGGQAWPGQHGGKEPLAPITTLASRTCQSAL